MRLAIIADIHANLHALEAVLADIAGLGVDEVIVNGDLVNRGPNNVAVLERLAGPGFRWTLGNHDDLLCKWAARDADIPSEWFGDPFWGSTDWAARQVETAGLLPALTGLPMTVRIEEPGAPSVLIAHGSPRHYREGYSPALPEAARAELVEAFPADILIGSHTHRPWEWREGRHLFLNTGSVGAPFNGDPRAQYLLLTLRSGAWAWEFRGVPYDQAAALAAFESSGLSGEGSLSTLIFREELRHSRPIYPRFWGWAEEQARPMDWEMWREFCTVVRGQIELPETMRDE